MAQQTELQTFGTPGMVHSFTAKTSALVPSFITLECDSFLETVVTRNSHLMSSIVSASSFITSLIERWSTN
jgi:hypothetical protein